MSDTNIQEEVKENMARRSRFAWNTVAAVERANLMLAIPSPP